MVPDTVQTAEREAAKYARVWRVPAYRVKSHSLKLWEERRDLFPETFESGIDLGCGLGRLLPVWESVGIEAWGVDLVPLESLEEDILAAFARRVYTATLWEFEPGRQFSVGICTDVMEHLPTRFVGPTLSRMASYCDRVVFKIANFNSQSLGEQLHLTQQPAAWWLKQLTAHMGGTARQVPYATDRPEYVFTWESGACES